MRKFFSIILCLLITTPVFGANFTDNYNLEIPDFATMDWGATISGDFISIDTAIGIVSEDITGRWVNVKTRGVIGDGATDDTTKINAIITSLTSGGTVYFPLGTYKITSGISADDNIILKGDGWGSIINNAATDGSAAICYEYNGGDRLNGFGIEDLTIQGNASSGAGIRLNGTERWANGKNWILRCKIYNHGDDGVYWEYGDSLTIEDCYIMSNDNCGIELFGQTNSGKFEGNAIAFNQYGIYMNFVVSDNLIIGNAIHDNDRYGVWVHNGEGARIVYNALNRNGGTPAASGHNAAIGISGSATKSSDSCLVDGNLMGDNGDGSEGSESGYSIRASNTTALRIKDNTFYAVDEDYFIRLADQTKGTVIEGNHFKDKFELGSGILEVATPSGTGTITFSFLNDASADSGVTDTVDWRLYDRKVQFTSEGRGTYPVILQSKEQVTDAYPWWTMTISGDMNFGSGTGALDTRLYRGGANILSTDDAFRAGTSIRSLNGDIKMYSASNQGYIYAYDQAGTDYIRMYHNGSNALIGTNAGSVTLEGNTTVIGGGADTDYQIKFDGNTTQGYFKWMEDEDRFDSDIISADAYRFDSNISSSPDVTGANMGPTIYFDKTTGRLRYYNSVSKLWKDVTVD